MHCNTILGLDPSTKVIGYALYSDSLVQTVIQLGEIKIKAKKLPERYWEIAQSIKTLLKMNKPNLVGVESSFFGRNVGVAIKLGVVRGIITGLVYTLTKAKLFEITPAEERQALGLDIKKYKDKSEVHKALKWQFKQIRDIEATEDELDALAVAVATKIKATEVKYVEDYRRKSI